MNENPEFKMFLVNQIARFLNQLYLQNKMIKWGDFLLAATNLWKLKVCQS